MAFIYLLSLLFSLHCSAVHTYTDTGKKAELSSDG